MDSKPISPHPVNGINAPAGYTTSYGGTIPLYGIRVQKQFKVGELKVNLEALEISPKPTTSTIDQTSRL